MLLALIERDRRFTSTSPWLCLDLLIKDECLVDWLLRGLAGDGSGEVVIDCSERVEELLSEEQNDGQEPVLDVLLFSQRWGCKKESSEFCFLSGWLSKSSFSVEKSSWLRASSLKPFMAVEGKMEGSEHRRLKGFVKASNIASEEQD